MRALGKLTNKPEQSLLYTEECEADLLLDKGFVRLLWCPGRLWEPRYQEPSVSNRLRAIKLIDHLEKLRYPHKAIQAFPAFTLASSINYKPHCLKRLSTASLMNTKQLLRVNLSVSVTKLWFPFGSMGFVSEQVKASMKLVLNTAWNQYWRDLTWRCWSKINFIKKTNKS